ncbi:catalase [Amanita rubescens]|nr:catalase [Amanita rubescens]
MSTPHFTTSFGSPLNYPHASQRVSSPNAPPLSGLSLFQDFHLIDVLAHLGRERIPERIVHAKGAGAHGHFEVTHDLSDITSQSIFHSVGLKIPVTARFSTVIGELGSADTARDIHGFAVKLKTDEGIWDWVFLNTPTFFIRDPAKYPELIHAAKKNPQTNLPDADMTWDFLSQNPETIHQVMMLYSNRGTPDGFHRQHGFGGTTFQFCRDDGSFSYVKIHVLSDQGVKTLNAAEAIKLAGTDPDYSTRALYNDIRTRAFPSWTVYIQTMTREVAINNSHIVFDVTKVWPHGKFPLRPIGRLVLDRNPENFFDEIEQLAFAPSNMIPYIEPSPDPIIQARLFIYPDTQRYRLGVNHKQLPCNAPSVTVANHQRAGAASFISQKNRPNYQSSSQSLTFIGPKGAIDSDLRNKDMIRHEIFNSSAYRDMLLPSDFSDRDFEQPRELWERVWNDVEREAFVQNVAASLREANDIIKGNQLLVFSAVDGQLAERIAQAMSFNFLSPPNPVEALKLNLKRIKKDVLPNGPS